MSRSPPEDQGLDLRVSLSPSAYSYIAMFSAQRVEVRPVSRFFKALGDETRLRILALLVHGELCVCHLQEALELSQPNASRHLATLRNAGIVESRREGNWIYYRLAKQLDEQCNQHLQALVRDFTQREVLRESVERLLKSKGPAVCR